MSTSCTCHPSELGRHLSDHPGMPATGFTVPWDFTGHPRPDSPWEIPVGECTVTACHRIAAVYVWDFETWSWPQVCSGHGSTVCNGCGTAPADPRMGGTSGCQSCLPRTCTTCGGVNHLATGRMCSCWVSVEHLAHADIKAIFAGDGTFNVGTNGELSVAE